MPISIRAASTTSQKNIGVIDSIEMLRYYARTGVCIHNATHGRRMPDTTACRGVCMVWCGGGGGVFGPGAWHTPAAHRTHRVCRRSNRNAYDPDFFSFRVWGKPCATIGRTLSILSDRQHAMLEESRRRTSASVADRATARDHCPDNARMSMLFATVWRQWKIPRSGTGDMETWSMYCLRCRNHGAIE